MVHFVNIYCKNTGRKHRVPNGANLEDIYRMLDLDIPRCTSAKVNNKAEGLHYVVYDDKTVEYLDISSGSGMRTYTRSLFFVLYKALNDLYPTAKLWINTPVSNGYYCRIEGIEGGVSTEVVDLLRLKMKEIIKNDIPFHRETCRTEEAIELFSKWGLKSKAKLLKGYGELYTHYYTLGNTPDYFYGSLLVRTGQIFLFDVVPYFDGVLLRLPDPKNPGELLPMVKQDKMFQIFREQHDWQKILGVCTIGDFNEIYDQGKINELINVSEALQEKKIAHIADHIAENENIKVILISGPSSAGKTTFSKRLSVQLRASGKKPVAISLDDYFVNRVDTPLDENGEYDYENVNAMNMPLLSEHINALLNGDPVDLPRYDFPTGKSVDSGIRLQLEPENIVILEGIHALNPLLSKDIPQNSIFKIYASALTTILLDDHNYIPTSDNRLLRRIVRDYKYRGYSAQETIRMWPKVREGEYKWIYPFQEEADVMINTALLFELAALRQEALSILEQVPQRTEEYSEAYRLRKFLSYLRPISTQALPPTSLLREFLGGSTFNY